jgi:hypothetical protein
MRTALLAAPAAPPPLYRRVLGPDQVLHPAVAALHLDAGCTRARGVLTVTRGPTAPARLLGWLLRLPRAGTAVPVVLEVSRHGGEERWWRRFDEDVLVHSRQSAGPDGCLRERYGPVELALELRAVDGALRVTGRSAALRLGPLRWTVPALVAPHVDASVASSGGAAVVVQVRIALRLTGPLLAYQGEMTVGDA